MSNIGHRLKFSLWINDETLPRRRLIGEWFIVLIIATLALAAAAFSNAGKQVSFWAFDHELGWLSPPVDPRILIVQIDEASLEAQGRWPWPRAIHGQLIDRLADGGAKVIGYDVLFIEPSSLEDDVALQTAIKESQRVVLPAYVTIPGSNGRAYDLQPPMPEIAQAARAIGHVNVIFDPDGQVRRGQMQIAGDTEKLSHMTKVIAQLADPQAEQPQDEMIIAFNHIGSFPAISADQVIKGEVPSELLKGRIVLVGATALGLGDVLAVPGPAGSTMPGVEVQANMVNTMLTHSGIVDSGSNAAFAIAAILLLGVMLAYWWVKPTSALIATAGVGISAVALTAAILGIFRIWVTPLPLITGLIVAYPLWNWRRLSALNRFVEMEARALDIELNLPEFSGPQTFGFDTVARAANRLRAVIGEQGDRRRFLRDVVEGAPDALSVVDGQGNIIVANNIAIQLVGSASESTEFWSQISKVGPLHQLDDEEVELQDGRTMLIKSAPLPGTGPEAGGYIVRIIDITERREIERQRNEFLEFLSHDMRAPQANILRILDLANSSPDKKIPLTRIRDHAETSLKLADDFVQLARLSVLTPNLSVVDLRSIIEEAIDRCFDAAQARKVRVKLDAAGDCVFILADPWLLMRSIGNLLDNAIKYSVEGGTVDCVIAIKAADTVAREQVTFEIRDYGLGIAAERLTALFERFGPNDATRGLSAGLGLAFVKKTMDLLHAEILCESDSGGTNFRMTFELADDQDSIEPAY